MRARMTSTLVLSIALVMLLVCGGILWYAKHSAERNADVVMSAMAERIGHDLASEGPRAGFEDEERDLKAAGLAFLIADAQGRVVRPWPGPAPVWPRKNDGWRVVTTRSGAYTIVVGLPWDKTARVLQNQAAALLFLGLCVILTAGIGAWWAVGRTLSPIGALSRQATAATGESLRVRLSAPSEDTEVVELVATLNGLLERLADTAASRGRFYAAASHELRTPLQALTGHMEMALARERTREEYRAGFEEAYQQARQLTSLVRDLLLLNQLDAAPTTPALETVNLADICERVLRHYVGLIAERWLQVQTEALTDDEILAPQTHIDMLVRNLIENAVKYATPGGVVRLEIVRSANGVTEVSNHERKGRDIMKSRNMLILLTVLAGLILVVLAALGQPKGTETTVKGEVVDLWCYLEGGDHGANHKACAISCAKAGNPIGIVDSKGNVYVAMGIKDHQPGREVLIDKMAQTVTVKGTLVKKGGTQVIYVKSVQ
jgi:signal transduction histidine kinase